MANAPVSPAVAASLQYCRHLTRTHARNFYYGLKLTPEPRRSALFTVYAYSRACDDLVDDHAPAGTANETTDAALARLAAFRRDTDLAVTGTADAPLPPGPIWPALRHAVRQFPIDAGHLHHMLDGRRMDLTTPRYDNFDDLYAFCHRVASAAGLVCLDVWGHDGDPGVPQLAEYRGIAFQLTSILRDVARDARCGRIYFPGEDLDRFSVDPDQLPAMETSANLDRLLQFQVERARSYYEMSATLERHLSPDCRAASWTMAAIYRRLLERIARDPRRVLRRRIRLSPFQKLAIATRGTLKRNWR